MNKFSEYCCQLLDAENTNLYHFCTVHNLERTGIRRMLSGERLPKEELFQAFVNALTLTPPELKKLLELYEQQKIGEERFQNRIYINNMLSYIGEIQQFQRKQEEVVIKNWEITKEKIVLMESHMEIIYAMQKILQTEKGQIYTNIPMECPDFFQLLQQEFCIRNNRSELLHFLSVLKKSEIPYDVNYNLRLMKNILPFALQEKTNYHPFYYYSNYLGRDSVALYPFYFLSTNYLLLLGENFHKAIFLTEKAVIKAYYQEIRRLAEKTKPFIFKPENPQTALDYYIKKCILISRPVYTLEYYPCIFHGYDRDLFMPFLKKKGNFSDLMKAADALAHSVLEYRPYDAFISREGFLRFAQFGELSGQFMQVLSPFSREVRKEILSRIEGRCRQGLYRLHIVPENILNSFPKIGLELYENRMLVLISCAEINSYSILNEKTLYGAFEDYFSSLLSNPEVTTVEDTIKFLEKLQRLLENDS